MKKRTLRRKPLIVDGQAYEASVTAIHGEAVELRVTLRAFFGTRSFCTLRGLTNFAYYYNYGYWNDPNYNESSDVISVTPRMLAALVAFARENGWAPETEKSNVELTVSNETAKSLLRQ